MTRIWERSPRVGGLFLCLVIVILAASACSPAAAPTQAPSAAGALPPASATSAPAKAATPAAAAATSPASVKPLDPPVTIKIGATGAIGDGFFKIADAKGYFAAEGLKPEYVPFRSATEMVAPLGVGDLDMGGGSVSPGYFKAVARGVPLKVVADRSQTFPGQPALVIMVRKDLIDSGKIKALSDLKGKTIALGSLGTSGEIFMEMALEKGGVKREDVQIVNLAFADQVVAFGGKSIDVSFGVEPTITMMVEQGVAVRWMEENLVYPNHQGSNLLYGPQFYTKQPEAAKRFMVTYIKAIRDYQDAFLKNVNKSEIVSILSKTLSLTDPALYDKMTPQGVDPNGYSNAKSISYDQDWYFSKKLIEQKIDMKDVVDNQYVEYALGRVGKR